MLKNLWDAWCRIPKEWLMWFGFGVAGVSFILNLL